MRTDDGGWHTELCICLENKDKSWLIWVRMPQVGGYLWADQHGLYNWDFFLPFYFNNLEKVWPTGSTQEAHLPSPALISHKLLRALVLTFSSVNRKLLFHSDSRAQTGSHSWRTRTGVITVPVWVTSEDCLSLIHSIMKQPPLNLTQRPLKRGSNALICSSEERLIYGYGRHLSLPPPPYARTRSDLQAPSWTRAETGSKWLPCIKSCWKSLWFMGPLSAHVKQRGSRRKQPREGCWWSWLRALILTERCSDHWMPAAPFVARPGR